MNDPRDAYEGEHAPGRVRGAFRALARSGMLTGLMLAALIAGLGVAYHEHGRGNLHKLKQRIGNERQEAPRYRPGGQDPIVLTRTRLMVDSAPEFTSVTLLPGRGMNVLQITAFVPGKGEVELLASPSIEDAEKAMTGTGADARGAASLAMGAAFEAPWAGRGGRSSGTVWRGRPLGIETAGDGGLLLARPSRDTEVNALPDGGHAQASFEVGPNAAWPWKAELTVTVLLSSKSVDLTMTARNTSDTTEPMGLGWRPRFALAGGRSYARLRLPAEMRVATRADGAPTGTTVRVAGTPYDFTPRQGVRLGNAGLDECFTELRQDLLDSGPVAELSFPAQDYGVRLTALSPAIKAMQVTAPANAAYLVVAPQFNSPDPFGREWTKGLDSGMVALQPGQTSQWKVRVEIFSPASDGTDH